MSLALGYFGVSKYLAVPIAAAALVAITSTGSFRSWERFMYVFIVANFLVIPLLILAHPHVGDIVHHAFRPGHRRRRQLDRGAPDHRDRRNDGGALAAVLPAVEHHRQADHPALDQLRARGHGDRRVRRGDRRRRADRRHRVRVRRDARARPFSDAGGVATQLGRHLGSTAGTFFAIVLLNASLIGAAAVTLSTSYAFGDVFGAKHSLNRGPLDAKLFYASFALMVMAAAGIVLIPGAPLGLITTSVQALAGVLLPSATVFLLLLCNDREVLGPWSNRRG